MTNWAKASAALDAHLANNETARPKDIRIAAAVPTTVVEKVITWRLRNGHLRLVSGGGHGVARVVALM